MAFKKFGFLLICALVVGQVAPGRIPDDVQDNDLAKQVKEVIVTVTGLLEKIIVKLDEITSTMTKGIDAFQIRTVGVTFDILNAIKKVIDETLDDIRPTLSDEGKKVRDCMKAYGNESVSLIVSYYNATSICFNPDLVPLLVSLEPLLKDLKKVDTDVAALAPELDKCENDLCVYGIIQKVIKEIYLIPDILKTDMVEIEAKGKVFWTGLQTCAKKEADPWKKGLNEFINEVSACILK